MEDSARDLQNMKAKLHEIDGNIRFLWFQIHFIV